MQISEQGKLKLEKLIKDAEKKYTEAARLTSLYGFDQDQRGLGVYYRDQLNSEAHLKSLLEVNTKIKEVISKKSSVVAVGSQVTVEINEEEKTFFIDGFRYENNPPVLTPETTFGRVLLGKKSGETFEYQAAGQVVSGKILSID